MQKLITRAPSKSCASDPLPTSIVKQCVDELSPAILSIINLCLESGEFPEEWKGALVKPMIKKPKLELIKKNFRPVSNLQFLSKLTEKAVAQQAVSHVITHMGFCLCCNQPIVLFIVQKQLYSECAMIFY